MLTKLIECEGRVLDDPIISAHTINSAWDPLEDWQEDDKVADTEEAFTADAKKRIKIIAIKELLLDHEL